MGLAYRSRDSEPRFSIIAGVAREDGKGAPGRGLKGKPPTERSRTAYYASKVHSVDSAWGTDGFGDWDRPRKMGRILGLSQSPSILCSTS